jgi:predicted metal-dependent hydrolase
MEIGLNKGLTVVIPQRCSLDVVQRFLQRKRRWVLDKLARFGHAQDSPAAYTLKTGDKVPYLGRAIEIVARESETMPPGVSLGREGLRVCTKPGKARLRLAVEAWYRNEGEKVISSKVTTHAARLGVTYNRITLRAQKTRWGSCSKLGNLNFNWRLLMAPEAVIDYVVIHELAHLKEMNHSKRFWGVVAEHCPRWREHRKWLKDHQEELVTCLTEDVRGRH